VPTRRWVVERLFAWIDHNRRLAKDVEATITSAEAFLILHRPWCCFAGWHVDEPIRDKP